METHQWSKPEAKFDVPSIGSTYQTTSPSPGVPGRPSQVSMREDSSPTMNDSGVSAKRKSAMRRWDSLSWTVTTSWKSAFSSTVRGRENASIK
jgi:hypothetical protein